MAYKFPEASRFAELSRAVWHRTLGGSRSWHNRCFAAGQSIDRDDLGFTVRWNGRAEVRAKHLRDLPRRGGIASILASGPSVRSLRRIGRLFDHPVACVNGSVTIAAELGRRADYHIISDYRFIFDKPELFRIGAAASKAIVLGPMSVFAAMLVAPDVFDTAEVFLREDLYRPFKRQRPSRRALQRDSSVLTLPGTDLAFSLDPARGTCPAGTVVFDALQVLFGIGYRELFMFGVDLSDGPRFYGETTPAPSDLARSYDRRIEPAFELVAEHLRRSGRTLVNGSIDSRLPATIIPKADGNRLLDELERRSAAEAERATSRAA